MKTIKIRKTKSDYSKESHKSFIESWVEEWGTNDSGQGLFRWNHSTKNWEQQIGNADFYAKTPSDISKFVKQNKRYGVTSRMIPNSAWNWE